MGCAPSNSARKRHTSDEDHQELGEWLNGLLGSDNLENLLIAYIELEKDIVNEECQSPASVLGLAISRQQQLKALIQAASEKKEKSGGLVPQENSLQEIFADLGLHRGSGFAAEHEEFIANINRKALGLNLLEVLGRRMEMLEKRIRTASQEVVRLQALYEKQDLLLGRIYGDAFGSEKEMVLEEEIDTLRNYRDAFSSGALLWKDSANIAEECAQLLSRGVAAWRSVHSQRSMDRKVSMATEARNAIQEAVILIEMSHDLMPGVQFPYCTKRELTAIYQAIEYIFTDILIEERYRHALQVYKNFHERATALSHWINQVFDSTLKKDLEDIDRSILKVSESLRRERINIICEKLGIESRSSRFIQETAVPGLRLPEKDRIHQMYGRDGKDAAGLQALGRMFRQSDLHAEFEKNLAARRSTMWPSRRIEELQAMVTNGGKYS